LAAFLLASQATVVPNGTTSEAADNVEPVTELAESGVHVRVLPAQGVKCDRCRNFRTTVGGDQRHPLLCTPCAELEPEPAAVETCCHK
jgi:hypothetical protein